MPTVFPYYGAKGKLASRIVEMFPKHDVYVEPFFGSGAVFFAKMTIANASILNDRDGNIVNLFRVIRDQPEELAELMMLTPHARDENEENCRRLFEEGIDDDMERARVTLAVIQQSFRHVVKRSGWSYVGGNSRVAKPERRFSLFSSIFRDITEASQLLRRSIMENQDAIEIIDRYRDNRYALIYCDPPYMHDTRKGKDGYSYEMADEDHVRFIDVVKSASCAIAISGYNNDLYNEAFSDWSKKEWKQNMSANNSRLAESSSRTEVLWMNYGQNQQQNLF